MLEPAGEFVAPEGSGASAARPAEVDPAPLKPAAAATPPKKMAAKSAVAPRQQRPLVATIREDCRLGNGWADQAICKSANLTALDRQHGLLYAQSWGKADEVKRAALLGSRDRFQLRRNACRSENCLTNTYIARLREISDIMARGSEQ
jgi:hypothetical protein